MTWETFSWATFNMGVVPCRKYPDRVQSTIQSLLLTDVIGISLQEAQSKEAQRILRKVLAFFNEHSRHPQVHLYKGRPLREGSDATPILIQTSPHVKWKDSRTVQLTEPTRTKVIRRVAGPARVKAKYLNMVHLDVYGRDVWGCSEHGPASVWWPPRARLAREMFRDTADTLDDIHGLVLNGADYNMKPDNPILNPLDRIGLKSAQLTRGPKGTDGRRPIDDIRSTNDSDRLRLVSTHTHDPNTFDHKAFVATFKIKVD